MVVSEEEEEKYMWVNSLFLSNFFVLRTFAGIELAYVIFNFPFFSMNQFCTFEQKVAHTNKKSPIIKLLFVITFLPIVIIIFFSVKKISSRRPNIDVENFAPAKL